MADEVRIAPSQMDLLLGALDIQAMMLAKEGRYADAGVTAAAKLALLALILPPTPPPESTDGSPQPPTP